MKSRTLTCMTAIALFAALAIPGRVTAQEKTKHQHYILYDVGTFGGPGSNTFESQREFTRDGALVGWADTKAADRVCLASILETCLVGREADHPVGTAR